MFHLRDELSEQRFAEIVTELRRLVWMAQGSSRRARIGLEIVVEDRRVSQFSEIVVRHQPLRNGSLTPTGTGEQT